MLTVDAESYRLDIRSKPRNSGDTFYLLLIELGADDESIRPSFGSIRYRPQSELTCHCSHVTEPEITGDVTTADVDIEAWRRITAERDAAERGGLVLDQAYYSWRYRRGTSCRNC
jgi:hypothetical protein